MLSLDDYIGSLKTKEFRHGIQHEFRIIKDGIMSNVIDPLHKDVKKYRIQAFPNDEIPKRKREARLIVPLWCDTLVTIFVSQSVIDTIRTLELDVTVSYLILNSRITYEEIGLFHSLKNPFQQTDKPHFNYPEMSTQSKVDLLPGTFPNEKITITNENVKVVELTDSAIQTDPIEDLSRFRFLSVLHKDDIPVVPMNYVPRSSFADMICDQINCLYLYSGIVKAGRSPVSAITVSNAWFDRFKKQLKLQPFSAQEILEFKDLIVKSKGHDIGDAIFRHHPIDQKEMIANKLPHKCSIFRKCILNDLLPNSIMVKTIGQMFWTYLHLFVNTYFVDSHFLSPNSKVGLALLARPLLASQTANIPLEAAADHPAWTATYYYQPQIQLPPSRWVEEFHGPPKKEWKPSTTNIYVRDQPQTSRS